MTAYDDAKNALADAIFDNIYIPGWATHEDAREASSISSIVAALSAAGYALVKRDPFTAVGLTPPAEDLDRVGKLAARVAELESDYRIAILRLARVETWLDANHPEWQIETVGR